MIFCKVFLVDGERCRSQYSNDSFNNRSSLCAENGHSASCEVHDQRVWGQQNQCKLQGDSGGPLTVLDSGERHTLVGLVSKRLLENHCNKVRERLFSPLQDITLNMFYFTMF